MPNADSSKAATGQAVTSRSMAIPIVVLSIENMAIKDQALNGVQVRQGS